jgi:hypothetical protein
LTRPFVWSRYLHGRQIQIQKTDAFLLFGGPGTICPPSGCTYAIIVSLVSRRNSSMPLQENHHLFFKMICFGCAGGRERA